MDNKIETIGVHGMVGVGKTTILKQLNNRLHQEVSRRVIWATASKDQFDIVRLQARILDGFKVGLSEGENKAIRAGELFSVLSKQEEYVLILDDLWDNISLNNVGIPRPSSNRSKIVVTSRSWEVLHYLDCEIVKVEPLEGEISWKLFLEKVGKSILEHPDLISIVKSVAKECSGLPLAIITVASSMKGVYEVGEWRNALTELRKDSNSINSIDGHMFKTLQFSYDHLKGPEIQRYFLSCSFYPKDEEIKKKELIHYWIGDGMMQEMRRRSDQIDRCNSIISKLINNCLLERGILYENTVKMHDLVRAMALQITRTVPGRFFIKAGMHVNKIPSNEEFGENVEKVSLMSSGTRFGDYWTPSSRGCLRLTTLFLQDNNIDWIPECFFKGMPNLMFLNLSENPFKTLPNSLSDLKNLTSLIARCCTNLEKVPCLSNLQGLKQLDLCGAKITELPMGMEELVNLKYFCLCLTAITEFPKGILGKLFNLQYLDLKYLDLSGQIRVGREVANLKRLEYIRSGLGDVSDMNTFVKSRGQEFLPCYLIIVGYCPYYIRSKSPDATLIVLGGVHIGRELIELPSNLRRSLNDCVSMTSLREATGLRYLDITNFSEMECVFSAGCPSTGMLSSLARIQIIHCNKLEELFSFDCLPPNLDLSKAEKK